MRKKGKMCSNFERIEKMEDCEDIRKQIWILCFTSKVPKYTGGRVGQATDTFYMFIVYFVGDTRILKHCNVLNITYYA